MRGSAGTQEYLRESYAIETQDILVCELNMNRYAPVAEFPDSVYGSSVDVDTLNSYKKKFPADSIVKPERPAAGVCIPMAKTTGAKWYSTSFMNNVERACVIHGEGTADQHWTLPPRFMYANTKRPYKAFAPAKLDSGATIADITVDYTEAPWANKIVVGFEDTIDSPVEYDILVNDSIIASDVTLDSDGRVSVYHIDGDWQTTPVVPEISDCIKIESIRVKVNSMNRVNAKPVIIEISPRAVFELTDRLQSWSVDVQTDEGDTLAPVGTSSSNSGSIILSNDGFAFDQGNIDPENPSLADFAKKYAEFTLTTIVNSQSIQQFVMYAESWDLSDASSASVSLFDRANSLQSTSAPDFVMSSVTPTQAIWRMLDLVGFDRIKIRRNAGETEPIMPFFFADNQQTVWESIQSLCSNHQYAVFVDHEGYLNICTKGYLYQPDRDSVWTFRSQISGDDLPDIISHSSSQAEPINTVSVKYQPMGRSASNNPSKALSGGIVSNVKFANRIAFGEEEQQLIGIAQLTQAISSGSLPTVTDTDGTESMPYVQVAEDTLNKAKWGHFSGYFLIDQEIFKYDGLQYSYTDRSDNETKYRTVRSQEEVAEIRSVAVGSVTFTGNLMRVERAQFGTTKKAHSLVLGADWTVRDAVINSVDLRDLSGNYGLFISHSKAGTDGKISIWRSLDRQYTTFTTKVRISNSKTAQRAGGIIIWPTIGTGNVPTDGYYVELSSSEINKRNVSIMRLNSTTMGRTKAKYWQHTIKEGTWYTLSVKVSVLSSGKRRLSIYVNGSRVGYFDTGLTPNNRVGLMATGKSSVMFDSFSATVSGTEDERYATQAELIKDLLEKDDSTRGRPISFHENFDNSVREIYYREVRFEQAPALDYVLTPIVNSGIKYDDDYSGPLVMKSSECAAALGDRTPFSATIAIANVGEAPRIISSPDGSGGYPQLSGPVVERYEEIEYKDTNKASIQLFGEKKFEVSGDNARWISTQWSAKQLTDWLLDVWADAPFIHQMTVFANMLIQPGDVVEIVYPEKNISGSFLVTGVSNSNDSGISTSITAIELLSA